MYRTGQAMERLIARATVDQRCLLGFPRGHAYWTAETLAAVAARYRALGMDRKRYEDALQVTA